MAIWAYGTENLPSWFKHNEEIDVSWEQIKELFDTGNNVMFNHSGEKVILWVDHKRFTQR